MDKQATLEEARRALYSHSNTVNPSPEVRALRALIEVVGELVKESTPAPAPEKSTPAE